MNETSLVSVVIPTYNRAYLISRAIKSVIGQTHSAWELIVVDDGSTDDTENVVGTFLHDSRIVYYRKGNSGAANSRNFGVERATADFVTFLDSDDEAEPDWLQLMMASVREKNASVVCCGLKRWDNNGKILSTELPSDLGPLFPSVIARFTNGGVYLLRRRIFVDIGGFDNLLKSGQHTELAYRLIPFIKENHLVLVNIMVPLINVHIHDGPRIRFDNEAIYLGSTRTLEKHADLFKRDRSRYINYLSVAGVSGIRTGRYAEAKGYFFKVVMQRPFSLLSWTRLLVCHIPRVRDWMWKTDEGA